MRKGLSLVSKKTFLECVYATYSKDNLDYLFALMDAIRITINCKRGKTTIEDELTYCEGFINV